MSQNDYWTQIRELVESGHHQGRTKRDIREEIAHLVQAAHADEEPWAAEVLTRWITNGADEDYTKVFKDMNSVTYIRANGQRMKKTVGYSRPKRSTETGAVVGYQLQAWWGMSRYAVELLRDELLSQGERLADATTMLDQLLGAWSRHPSAATARDAWEADGRSVAEIDLTAMTGT